MVLEKIIVFDWDGTIISSDVSKKANERRSEFINSNISVDELHSLMKSNNSHYKIVQESIQRITGVADSSVLKRLQTYLFTFFYQSLFNGESIKKYSFYDVQDLLKIKEKYGLKFVICTGLIQDNINSAVSKLEVELFDEVYGLKSDLSDSKFDSIKKIINKYGKENILCYFGDTEEDAKICYENSLNFVFCKYGLLSDSVFNPIVNLNCRLYVMESPSIVKFEEILKDLMVGSN